MSFLPTTSWLLVTVLVVAACAALLAGFATRRLGGQGRRAILTLNVATGLLLLLAALNPTSAPSGEPMGSHLVVVLDVSRSVQRAGASWIDVRRTIGDALGEVISGLRPTVRRASTASLVTFGRGVNTIARDVPVDDLPQVISRLTEDVLPPGNASDIEAGLGAAARILGAAGRGAVVLVSDGHETEGDARAAARDLGRRGFAVHVVALGGRSPEIGLYAADLPRQVEAERPTSARLLLANSAEGELDLDLIFRRAGGESTARSQTLPGSGWFQLRQPIVFDQPGLRHLDLELTSAAGQRQSRRFFTYVSSPPRLLVVGDDHRWTRALSPEQFDVELTSPEDLDVGLDLDRFDAVVLSEVEAERLPPGYLERLAEQVRVAGLGVLVVNGAHVGPPEARSLLMSFDGTPLEELMPLVNKPRPVLDTPPPRSIVILIDTSGSMSGWRLDKSKQIAAAIIARLRGVDRLNLITFTGGAHPLLSDVSMTEAGKDQALAVISSLNSGGGTDPTTALELIQGRRLQDCGLFMISDGEFGAVSTRPDCESTVFAIGKQKGGISSALSDLAEPFPVPDDSFDPAGIQIGFFDPKPRDNRFEPGRYTPLPGIDAFYGGWSLLPNPSLPLEGNAVTHARVDAEVAAVRPRPRDPVLAFRDARQGVILGGTVGTLTTRLPPSYYGSPRGERAIMGWIARLLAHADRDRYAFHLEDRGNAIDLRLTVLSKGAAVPRISRVSASLELTNPDLTNLDTVDSSVDPGTGVVESVPVALRPDPELAGVFAGTIRLPQRPAAGVRARLVLSESGPDALRRAQRIPLDLPPAGDGRRIVGDEAWSFGLNPELLTALAAAGGGRVLEPGEGAVLLHGAGLRGSSGNWWRWLVGAAIVLLLVQVGVRRILA